MLAAVFVFFALAMIVGPLMLMRPTASQARIAALRAQAEKNGLRIRLAHNPFAPKSFSLAVYVLPKRDEQERLSVFSLFRKSYVHEMHFCNDWDWVNKAQLTPNNMQALKSYLSSLDKNIVGVESGRGGVGLYWCERMQGMSKEDAVQKIQVQLQTLKEVLQG